MVSTVNKLKVKELETIISNTVRKVMQDEMEDILALTNINYINSIEKSRNEYKNGKVKKFKEVFNV